MGSYEKVAQFGDCCYSSVTDMLPCVLMCNKIEPKFQEHQPPSENVGIILGRKVQNTYKQIPCGAAIV